jgi:hypothetical protein
MEKQHKRSICDISSFEDEVPIYKVLFQDKAITLLKNIIEQIANDKYDRNNTKYPSILVIGNNSKSLVAQALSNSLCFSLEEIQGDLLGNGGQYNNLYENVHQETLYHITSCDKLTNFSVSILNKFLKQGYILCKNPLSGEQDMVHMMGKMFVFSAKDAGNLNSDLLKAIDYHCYLDDYNSEQLRTLVEQRL